MNTLRKTKLRGTGINCGLIVLLFAVVLLLGQVLPENTYRRVLVPIINAMLHVFAATNSQKRYGSGSISAFLAK